MRKILLSLIYGYYRIAQNLQPKKFPQIFIAIALLCSSLIVAGQTTIAVAPAKMNVFYTGVDNPVSVAASGSSDNNVTVTISGVEGTVTKTAAGLYNVRVNTLTDNCLINVYANGKLAGTSVFRVRNLPPPNAIVGGFVSGSTLSKDVLKTQPGVAVFIKDAPFDLKYDVIGFNVKMLDDANKPIDVYCEGAAFSAKARQCISDFVKPGDLVTIQNIRAKDVSGREIKIPGLVYNIN